MREKVTLNVQLRADRATMEINIDGDQRRIAGVVLTAQSLDSVMAALATIRSKMTPEVPHFPGASRAIGTKRQNTFWVSTRFLKLPCFRSEAQVSAG